jgi:signal transduction histidine kinase/CheY-like chemotaxis protein
VYSPFRMNDLLRETLPDDSRDIVFRIYDGTKISPADLMYEEYDENSIAPDEKDKLFSSRQTTELYGHQWTLAFETRSSFDVPFSQFTSWSILAGGLFISLLIFFFIRQQEKSRKEQDVISTELKRSSQVTEDKSEQLGQSLQDAAKIETGLENSLEELEVLKNIADESRKEAELANTAKSSFLANMSHEIRTPMNSVLGFLQIVLEDNALSANHRKHLNMAYGSAHNLLTIINDILDVNKLNSDNFELEIISFNLPQTIENILRTLEPSAKEKGIALVFDFDDKLPHYYSGDPIRLGQIILNLIGNAIKFTKIGNITTAVRASDQGGDLLHFSAADTGIGMTPEQVTKIFDRFSQADISTARSFGGTGLGLTIARQIVKLMGGLIWVESELGHGSIFHFTAQLPKASNTADFGNHGLTMEALPLKPMRHLQILMAEDILENAILMKLRLEQRGHTMRHVWNGREAVELHNTSAFDLILMDVMMPEMDGLEATRKIRELEEESNKHITIIALTASIMAEDHKNCIEAGMDAVIGKPINLEELFSIIEKVVPAGIGTLDEDIIADFDENSDIDLTPLAQIVDIEKGLAAWKDPLIFAKSLISFIEKHSNDANKIQGLLGDRNIQEAKMISHALKGVAGNLSVSEIARLATEIDTSLMEGNIELAGNLIQSLQEALQKAFEMIDQLKIPVLKKLSRPTKEFDSKAVISLLQELLSMLEQDNPAVAEPAFNKLTEYISINYMANVRKAIDDFDFNQAKLQTKILAEKLGLKMEI